MPAEIKGSAVASGRPQKSGKELNMKTETHDKKNGAESACRKKLNVAIFFGGCSPEYSVSLSSASGVIRSLNPDKYTPVLIGITNDGRWFHFDGAVEEIEKDTWAASESCTPAALSPNRGERRLLLFRQGEIAHIAIDVALPILHGKNGEDGTLQGLLELADIPVAGCGTLASALCMDKDRAHRLAACAGVQVPRSMVLEYFPPCAAADASASGPHTAELTAASVSPSGPSAAKTDAMPEYPSLDKELYFSAQSFAQETGYPIFVKPVKAGSSYGVTKVSSPEQLAPAVELAFRYDDQVILEENIEGFEVGCAVLGRSELITGEVDEIELSGGFFDFTEKYTLKTSSIHVPARIAASKSAEIKETAKTIYRALGCSGFARIDMFLTPEGKIVFNEVNTIPGFTEHSRYPGMMKAAGYSFESILDMILEQTLAH